MATRQNKKRKSRNNAPPRERTVTTLTDGPDGPFMSSPADDSSASLMSPPFSVSAPIPPSPQPPPSPFPLQPFSAPFPYSFSHMPSIGSSLGGSFQPQAPPPQFFSSQPSAIQQSTPLAPSQQPAALPQGQNDLEILERLKETIKSNQHELFRPIPQPAALAGVFLGPRSTLVSSHVPPHPEQIPTDTSPPGLTRITPDNARSIADALLAKASKQSTSSTPDLRDGALRKPAHRLSISESPKQNTMQPPQSPVKRVDRYESAAHSASGLGRQDKPGLNGAGSSPRFGNVDASPRMGPPGSQRLEQSGRSGEIAQSPASISAKLPPVDSKDDPRRESSWSARNGSDDRDRPGAPAARSPGNVDSRGSLSRDERTYDREKERLRDRERSRDRDYDRDKDRDRRPDYSRFRDDRRPDDRSRPPDDRRPVPAGDRRYDSRYPRWYNPKASEASFTARDDRISTDARPPPRNLGEERAIIRPPADSSASVPTLPEDRRAPAPTDARPPPSVEDRRAPLPPPVADRQVRSGDDRRPPLPATDRLGRPDDRRPPPLDRPVEDRRRPTSPAGSERTPRAIDDRRVPVPPPPAVSAERPGRIVEDRRPASPPSRPLAASEDRRLPPPATSDRQPRPTDDRRPHVLEERIIRPPVPAPAESARPPVEDRPSRPPQSDDRAARPVKLEERISRGEPSLQERLSYPPPSRPDGKPAPRLEERISRPPANSIPLEARLSNPPADARPLRPPTDDRPPPRQAPPPDRPVGHASDDRPVLTEAARAPPLTERPPPHSDDRHYAPARYTRPASPVASERGRPYGAPPVVRDEPRPYRPHSPARPPSRSEVREFRPAGERDRVDSRPPYRPDSDRHPPERRPDLMDVDSPRAPPPARASYRRPSPPPGDSYPPRGDRTWVPAGEAPPPYRDTELSRRTPADTHAYPPREWREGSRPLLGEDYDRSWDRSREYDRDGRFPPPDRDVPPVAAWETREERERRAAYPPVDLPPSSSSRSFEPRPLSSRLTDSYTDDRGYSRDIDRVRYPPPPVDAPATYSRVRPRSPSPLRKSTASDDLRPPLKRARDESYGGATYYPPEEPRGPPDYPPPARARSPPPASAGYYDDPRYNNSPGAARDRDYLASRDRDVGYAYDRRDPPGRMPPPRSPPAYSRPAYDRDDRRYSIPPR